MEKLDVQKIQRMSHLKYRLLKNNLKLKFIIESKINKKHSFFMKIVININFLSYFL